MLRRAAIASLGLRRLFAAATPAASSQPPILLLRFISSQPSVPPIGRLAPLLDLKRGFAWGFGDEHSISDEEKFGEVEFDEMDGSDMSDDSESEIDDRDMDFDSDEGDSD